MKCYLYVSEIDFGGTLIIWRLAIRWGSHAFLGRIQWYR